MVNIPINEAETIFEPFYDGGESYPDHEKFSCLSNYQITYAEGTVSAVEQTWSSVNVLIQSQVTEGYSVKMERDCQLDIRGYDRIRLFAAVSENMELRMQCIIDGQTVTVLEQEGLGVTGEYDGEISGNRITHYTLEFRLRGKEISNANLEWLGLANSERQAEMETKKSPFHEEWEGCFCENPELKPIIGIFFSEKELIALRERLNKEPFLQMTDMLRKKAEAAMQIEPEPYIMEYIPNHDRRWVRDRDMKCSSYYVDMDVLAFIGLLDNNIDMLRMACRKMLSVAVTPRWTESIMGCLPGATWHHRSFMEDELCYLTALVMDWAGSLLTWHGKNIVYDALMLKGLPRLQADFYSVEYIREMNQGIVFNNGRVFALLALAQRYPRYEALLQEAARDEREMIDGYIMEDGGTIEGPAYWNYTFSFALVTIAVLARHENKTLEEYAWEKLKQTGEFALMMLSDAKDGTYMLPVNDAHLQRYSPLICAVFKEISHDPRWNLMYNRVVLESKGVAVDLKTILLSSEIEEAECEDRSDDFQTLNYTGHTTLRRTTEDVGRVHCYLSGGPNYFAHCHGDKGQMILEVDRIPMLIDRGICAYSNPAVDILPRADKHNLFIPETPAGMKTYDQNLEGTGARVIRCSYENGILDYCTDLLGAWHEGIFQSVTRTIRSEDAHLYWIYDDAEFVQELRSSFRLNTYGTISQQENTWMIIDGRYQITVIPVNYTPKYAEYGEDGIDGDMRTVHSLKLYLSKAKEQHITTLLEVSLVGQNCAKILSENKIEYNGKVVIL